jgi:MoxR-like ATPase
MDFPYYTGNPKKRRVDGPAHLPRSRRARQTDPAGYIPDTGLVDAVNVALLLGQPLLLTGEPGTGKTQLAYSLAWELGFDEPFVFETKSTSVSRDLFYTYDALGHFRAAQTGVSGNTIDFITWNALGVAILRSCLESDVKRLLPGDFRHGGARRSVVLIDEIDKAPRDFPNDLLNEVENFYFRVPELGNVRIAANEEFRPILVLTSNSEKSLPEAFLRRCVYYNIPFPNDKDLLAEIVTSRVGGLDGGHNKLLSEALALFFELRDPSNGLHKRPSTAELIGWVTALREMGAPIDQSLTRNRESVFKSISVLVKNQEDQTTAKNVIERILY